MSTRTWRPVLLATVLVSDMVRREFTGKSVVVNPRTGDRSGPSSRDGALRGRGDEPGVLGEHPGLVARGPRLPVLEAAGELLLGHLDVQTPGVHVESDRVSLLDKRDGAADRRFGRHMAHTEPVGGPTEPTVSDQG